MSAEAPTTPAGGTPPEPDEDESIDFSSDVGHLTMLALFIKLDVRTLVRNHLIERVAMHLCTGIPKFFWRPFFNTPLMHALRAESDLAIMHIYSSAWEEIQCSPCRDLGKKRPKTCDRPLCRRGFAPDSVRRRAEIKNHRDAVCHPPDSLSRPAARKFVEEKNHIADVRAAIAWDAYRSINEGLAAANKPTNDLVITVDSDLVGVLRCVLSLCWHPAAPTFNDKALTEWLEECWAKDRIVFEGHPDGRLPRMPKEERLALWDTLVKEWEETHPPDPSNK